MRQPLIDADIYLYEVGFAAESGWKSEGFPPFDYVAELLNNRITNICAIIEATEPPILYLTGRGNFRHTLAKRTPYKVRAGNKPWHYANIKAYIKGMYDYRESEGMEADDLMAIEQSSRPHETIICTRDKDLRSVPGWHYGWECGNQPSFGPMLVDGYGSLCLSPCGKKLSGYGESFFYAQCLMGDAIDSIPGLGHRTGPVAAYKILKECTTSQEALKAVLEAYADKWGERAEEELLEQGRLLHMTRELHPDGKPILWELPDGN